MNFLVSLLWLPVAPAAFAWAQWPAAPAIGSLALTCAAAAWVAVAIRTRGRRAVRAARIALIAYLILAVGLIAADTLPGPGTRSALPPRELHALPAAPGSDFLPHPNPVLHVIPTGESRTKPAWTQWSGGQGEVTLEGALFVVEHPTYGLVVYEMSTTFEADAASLLRSAGLDPAEVRTVVAAELTQGPGVAARGLSGPWVLADPAEPHAFNAQMSRLQPVRFSENPGFGPFDHYFDLTGDGSILLLSSPGPRPGHIALFLRLRWGAVLLAGGIAPVAQNLASRSAPLPVSSAHNRQLGGVLWLSARHPNLIVVPGQDQGPLRRLERPDITLYGAD